MSDRIKRLILRAGYALALALLGVQTFIIIADFFVATLFFDELGSWLVTVALAWIIKKQRDIQKSMEQGD